jgi:hypothetical protein
MTLTDERHWRKCPYESGVLCEAPCHAAAKVAALEDENVENINAINSLHKSYKAQLDVLVADNERLRGLIRGIDAIATGEEQFEADDAKGLYEADVALGAIHRMIEAAKKEGGE